jgi:hypothetical protein
MLSILLWKKLSSAMMGAMAVGRIWVWVCGRSAVLSVCCDESCGYCSCLFVRHRQNALTRAGRLIRITTMLILPLLMKLQFVPALDFSGHNGNNPLPTPEPAQRIADWTARPGGAAFDLDLMNSGEQQQQLLSANCVSHHQTNKRPLPADANSWELHVYLRQKKYTNPNHPHAYIRAPNLLLTLSLTLTLTSRSILTLDTTTRTSSTCPSRLSNASNSPIVFPFLPRSRYSGVRQNKHYRPRPTDLIGLPHCFYHWHMDLRRV